MLATCLALFDDSRWQSRLERLHEETTDRAEALGKQLGRRFEEWRGNRNEEAIPQLTAPEAEAGARELSERQCYWLESDYSDDLLRLLLWARLRSALGLPARLTTTFRGCGFLADDMAARLIHVIDPPSMINSGRRWLHQRGWLEKGQHASSLDDVVLPVLDELLEQTLNNEEAPPSSEQRQEILRNAVASLDTLDEKSHQQLLSETQANRYNDAALRNALLLGGSLGTLGAGVSAAGFSAYILAAQASAFLPLISGSGLVSFISVLSNPITVLGVAGGGGWWIINSARDKVRVAVAARVMALLALQGKLHGSSGLDYARLSFSHAPSLPSREGISETELRRYREEWQRVADLPSRSAPLPPDNILKAMAQHMTSPTDDGLAFANRLTGESAQSGERQAAAAMATLTVGDVLYSVAAVDPTVVASADFVRNADIDNAFSFAEMASQLLSGSDREVLGGVSQLKGYVAEQAVAAQLVAAGHTVSLPQAANQPGWDLLVDGQPFQVKFHANLDGLSEHFERYDYPVIANAELASQIPDEWADSVFFVEGVSNELVDQVTRNSLNAGVELLNPSVISFAGTTSAARGLIAYRRGHLTGKQAVEQVLLDGMVRTGLAASGGVAGAGIGLLVFGPAGALVLGAGSPVLAQMMTTKLTGQLRQRVKGKKHLEWESRAHGELEALQRRVRDSLAHKQAQLEEKFDLLPDNQVGDYLRWRLQDEHDFVLECHKRLCLLDALARPNPEQRLADTLRVMAMCGVHPAIYQTELGGVNERLQLRPGLIELLDKQRLGDVASQGRGFVEGAWQSASEKAEKYQWKEKAVALKRRWTKGGGGPQ
ncbi:hypothetical protein [Onishia niordana]|uniref:hypothetical protein n=1 Tax=Onishia niordana TaxID=2508711 RepID=UPI001446BBDB|nr:hypothetical protein [Halomonas niordiana]